MPDWRNEECLQVDQSIMASNASSDALVFPVRRMPKTVGEKNIIFNVIKYFEDEKERHGKQKFRPNAVMQKAAEATGVPIRTLQRLSNGNSESKKIKSKKAKLSREKFGKLDDFDLGVIRRLIHQFYLRNESPTLDKILKELKEKMDFPYGRSRLHKLLKKMGFCFKFRGKERLIYERSDIIAWRERYLRAIKKFRENNPDKDIVYTDETWLNQGLLLTCVFYIHKAIDGQRGRLIISDAMTDKGPADGSLWIFKVDQGKKPNKKVK